MDWELFCQMGKKALTIAFLIAAICAALVILTRDGYGQTAGCTIDLLNGKDVSPAWAVYVWVEVDESRLVRLLDLVAADNPKKGLKKANDECWKWMQQADKKLDSLRWKPEPKPPKVSSINPNGPDPWAGQLADRGSP